MTYQCRPDVVASRIDKFISDNKPISNNAAILANVSNVANKEFKWESFATVAVAIAQLNLVLRKEEVAREHISNKWVFGEGNSATLDPRIKQALERLKEYKSEIVSHRDNIDCSLGRRMQDMQNSDVGTYMMFKSDDPEDSDKASSIPPSQ
ncbi:hypothetical protein BDV96DRAFT_638510 [Lophiotrema nucula]|uniref:Uncharacterized protein n=1 Tax=Lophiotrema nucula TaxID=690887 RepID=A0A6A5YGP5_9PLEO|nr:hypothetical protein BDV96DRAFT_638510 [Lophiotrema nucula]